LLGNEEMRGKLAITQREENQKKKEIEEENVNLFYLILSKFAVALPG